MVFIRLLLLLSIFVVGESQAASPRQSLRESLVIGLGMSPKFKDRDFGVIRRCLSLPPARQMTPPPLLSAPEEPVAGAPSAAEPLLTTGGSQDKKVAESAAPVPETPAHLRAFEAQKAKALLLSLKSGRYAGRVGSRAQSLEPLIRSSWGFPVLQETEKPSSLQPKPHTHQAQASFVLAPGSQVHTPVKKGQAVQRGRALEPRSAPRRAMVQEQGSPPILGGDPVTPPKKIQVPLISQKVAESPVGSPAEQRGASQREESVILVFEQNPVAAAQGNDTVVVPSSEVAIPLEPLVSLSAAENPEKKVEVQGELVEQKTAPNSAVGAPEVSGLATSEVSLKGQGSQEAEDPQVVEQQELVDNPVIQSVLQKPTNALALFCLTGGAVSAGVAVKLIHNKYLVEQNNPNRTGPKVAFRVYLVQQIFGTFDIKEPATIAKSCAAAFVAAALLKLF